MSKIKTIAKHIEEDSILYEKYPSDMNLDILGFFVNSNNYTNAKDRAILSFLTQSEEVCGRVRFLKQPCLHVSNSVVYDIKKAVVADRDSAFYINLPYELEYEKEYDWYSCLKSNERNDINYLVHILNNYDEVCVYLGNKFDIEEMVKQIQIIRHEIEVDKEEEK